MQCGTALAAEVCLTHRPETELKFQICPNLFDQARKPSADFSTEFRQDYRQFMGQSQIEILVDLDLDLITEDRSATGIKRVDDLFEAGLKALTQREAGIRLARLAGSQPDLQDIPRRRPKQTKHK
jgi:hypothetical protein